MTTDPITKRWIRNEADERAAQAGYRFDVSRGAYVVWWIERYCRLYEGEWAGEPLILRGLHSDWPREPIWTEWDEGGDQESLRRALDYMDGFDAGEDVDWQYECTMRVFGWVRHSDRWQREVRRFRKSAIWVPKKNKKTPTEGAWALYLTCGDGEQGQKCFLGAKDGGQAGLAADHAIAMVEASDELAEECKINRNLKRIIHLPTNSFLQPISSNDSRSQKSKEGLNGSLFVDEIHVVDREFMSRVKRLGISRSEPIVAQFSTAGNDPDGYGMEQWDYGRDVNSGKREDHQYFAAFYAADPDVTDAQIAADPVALGKACNPAWGHTIGEEEFLADYSESNGTVSALAEFKQYRLNVWTSSANPWRIAGQWAACESPRPLESFIGQECYLGGDLSRARDMSAIVATFIDEEVEPPEYYQFCWVWMVREYMDKYKHKAPFREWEQSGLLYICEGTIDLREIEDVIKSHHRRYPVREFRHDPAYAHELAANLEEEEGIVSVPFRQTILEYAKPVDDFEAAVISGTIHHDGHEVYAWQMGHAAVKSDPNNNRRIIKPSDDDYRKVDIVQAGIMSASGAMAADRGLSVYASQPLMYAGMDDDE